MASQGFTFRTLRKVMYMSMHRRSGTLRGHMTKSQESSHLSFQIRFVLLSIEMQFVERKTFITRHLKMEQMWAKKGRVKARSQNKVSLVLMSFLQSSS